MFPSHDQGIRLFLVEAVSRKSRVERERKQGRLKNKLYRKAKKPFNKVMNRIERDNETDSSNKLSRSVQTAMVRSRGYTNAKSKLIRK